VSEEVERREILDSDGALVSVQLWRGGHFLISWSAEFDRKLHEHPSPAFGDVFISAEGIKRIAGREEHK
jgi:hypothetical protein